MDVNVPPSARDRHKNVPSCPQTRYVPSGVPGSVMGLPQRTRFSCLSDRTVTAGYRANRLSVGRSRASPFSCTSSSVTAWARVYPAAMVRRREYSVPPQPNALPMSWQRVRI